MLDGRLAVRHGAELLVSGRPDQPGRALVLVPVLAAQWYQVRERNRVVGVGEAADAGQTAVQARSSASTLGRVR
jgi:hypothetical protein